MKPGDKIEWMGLNYTVDYLIRISGEKVENSSYLGDGENTAMEIPYSSLKFKNTHNKGDPVEVNIEVLALDKSGIIGKGGPFKKSMSSICSFITFYSLPEYMWKI